MLTLEKPYIKYKQLTAADVKGAIEVINASSLDLTKEVIGSVPTQKQLEEWAQKDSDMFLVGAFDDINQNKLVGVGILYEKEMPVVHLMGAFVLPEYRGMGIQKELIQQRKQRAFKVGAHILVTGVHPDRKASIKNLEETGFTTNGALVKSREGNIRLQYLLNLQK